MKRLILLAIGLMFLVVVGCVPPHIPANHHVNPSDGPTGHYVKPEPPPPPPSPPDDDDGCGKGRGKWKKPHPHKRNN